VNTRILLSEFEYLEPKSISDAVALLAKYGGDAKVIAGGTDLLVDMKKGRICPKCLISLNKTADLSYITEDERGLRIGARTTFSEVEESQVIRERYPLILEAAQAMGTVQIRNMATIGGNICNALPSADIPPALVALDAEVKIISQNGERFMPLEDFFAGIRKTKLGSHELLAEVIARRPPARSGTAFLKVGKTSEDLATVNVAARYTLAQDGTCKEARIVVGGGVGPALIRARESESLLVGKPPSAALFEEAGRLASMRLRCRPTSIRGSPFYKTEVTRALVKRALTKASERARGGAG
jgi:carbon-monoxide dehydrogenase medium subunit